MTDPITQQLAEKILHDLRVVLLDRPEYQLKSVGIYEYPAFGHREFRLKIMLAAKESLTIEWTQPLEETK